MWTSALSVNQLGCVKKKKGKIATKVNTNLLLLCKLFSFGFITKMTINTNQKHTCIVYVPR